MIRHGNAAWITVVACIFLAYGLLATPYEGRRLIVEADLYRKIRSGYSQKQPPQIGSTAIIYVFTQDTLGNLMINNMIGQVRRCLANLHLHRDVLFVTSSQIANYPKPFGEYLLDHAGAAVCIDVDHERFDETAFNAARRCPGRIIAVNYTADADPSAKSPRNHTDVDEFLVPRQANVGQMSVAGRAISERIISGTHALAASDSRLPLSLRPAIQFIRQLALPPVAEAYLRFRLCRSDLERFYAILDCVECLVRCSVAVCLVSQWTNSAEPPSPDLTSRLQRPSLGHWIGLLEAMARESARGKLASEICNFWKGKIGPAGRTFIASCAEAGFPWRGDTPRTYMDWLNCFASLRNSTRGHGVIAEETIRGLWHPLHEIFGTGKGDSLLY